MQKLKPQKMKPTLIRRVLSLLKTIMSYAIDIALMVIICTALLYAAARAPEMHGRWLRHSVGSKVYTIRDNPNGGGGTGFAIKAPSGTSYILTNDHVCEVSSDKQTVLVENEAGLSMRRRILAKSDFTDLCLIEGIPGVEGLSMGSEPMIGQIVAAVGHPSLMPITLSRGEIITQKDITISKGPISFFDITGQEQLIPADQGGIKPEQCLKPKNRQIMQTVDFGFFQIQTKVCFSVTEKAYRTNMLIQPGNSGSPMVNFYGHVIGVVFSIDHAMWGIGVSYSDIVKLLKDY